jgi:uncharacterized protein YkwD
LKSVRPSRGATTASVLCCAIAIAAQADPILASAGAPAPAPCVGTNLRPSARNAAAIDAATLCLVNRVRTAHRVAPLRSNGDLGRVAASQVVTMVRSNYFADVRPTGQTPLGLVAATRYPAHSAGVSVGQNIAWGTGSDATPARVVAAWMASAPHRRVMLDGGFRDAGVGATPRVPAVKGRGGHGATYAIEFGLRLTRR